MAKRKVALTETQKKRNEQILSKLREEQQRLFEDTRKLQQNWKKRRAEHRRRHSRPQHNMGD
jgi:hypothetical protein